jgi:lysozyme
MQLSAAGLALLKKSEGFRDRIYLDASGIPTIGYGHRILASESFPNSILDGEATELLVRDVLVAEQSVKRLIRVALTQGQFDALVDFVFNLGQGRLAASTLLQDLNIGRYDAAAEQLLRWDHARDRESAGLKARREAEFHLWHNPSLRQPVIA